MQNTCVHTEIGSALLIHRAGSPQRSQWCSELVIYGVMKRWYCGVSVPVGIGLARCQRCISCADTVKFWVSQDCATTLQISSINHTKCHTKSCKIDWGTRAGCLRCLELSLFPPPSPPASLQLQPHTPLPHFLCAVIDPHSQVRPSKQIHPGLFFHRPGNGESNSNHWQGQKQKTICHHPEDGLRSVNAEHPVNAVPQSRVRGGEKKKNTPSSRKERKKKNPSAAIKEARAKWIGINNASWPIVSGGVMLGNLQYTHSTCVFNRGNLRRLHIRKTCR